jgi:tripartite-type tricarboxylate transporter receptor subunit TctC
VPAVRKVPYDAVKDFTPIAMVAGTPNVLVVGAGVPASDMKSLVAWAKSNKASYGSAGQGSLTHLAMEQFRTAAGFDAVQAAYRGIGPAITDVLGGQTHMMMPGLAAALPHIKAGKLKPIAITGTARHALLPDTPTFEELGYKGFTGVQWYAIVGPAKMPPEIVKRLNEEINKAIATPELRQRLSGEALDPMPMTPEQFGRFMQEDIAKWAKLAQERNIKLEE